MRYFLILLCSFLTTYSSLYAQSDTDELAVRALVSTMESGWNNGSGEEFSSPFAESHTYIVWDGQYYAPSSRQMNAVAHDQLFKGPYQDTRLHTTIDQLIFVRPDVAIVHVLAALDKAENPRPDDPEVVFSLVVAKEGEKWEIVSFHNSDLEMFDRALPDAGIPMPLQYMFGSWYAAER